MKLRVAAVIWASLIAGAGQAQELKEITAESLIAKNIEARGGIDAIRAIRSVRFEGKMLVNNGQVEFGFTETKKRPNEIRTELTLQGMTLLRAYDGAQGWKVSPFGGRKDPEKMSSDEAKSLVEDADLEGPLVDWKSKGNTVEYLGPEDVDGTIAYKLKVTRKNGDISYIYLDPDYFLEIRVLTQRTEQGAQVEVETDLGDYEKVAGVFFPFSIEAGSKGSTDKQKVVIEKAQENTTVDDTTFKFPASTSK
jgi:outer membrane lipoprotein-sorting protein